MTSRENTFAASHALRAAVLDAPRFKRGAHLLSNRRGAGEDAARHSDRRNRFNRRSWTPRLKRGESLVERVVFRAIGIMSTPLLQR